jgi:two-component system, NarL family, response regulator YdfI
MRVFIVAATPRSRRGLETLLHAAGAETVGLAADLHGASDEVQERHAEVVLADAGHHSSEEWLEEFQDTGLAAGPPLLVMFEEPGANLTARALQAGVRGVLPSEAGAEQIMSALDALSKGLVVLHPTGAGVARPARSEEAELIEPLTPREREVLRMLAIGLGNKEIAARMKISEHTAKFHVAQILGKLSASSRTEAVTIGMRLGLVLL